MTENSKESDRKKLEEEIWSAIAAFEQILEAMPDDRASLETLSHAYSQIGDQAKAYEYLVRLGNVLIAEGNISEAAELIDRLRECGAGDADGTALIAEIERLSSASQPKPESSIPVAPGPVVETPTTISTSPAMSEELAFTWNLLQAGELTQEEYSSVVEDLTEMSGGDSSVTVSVLHALEARGFKGLDRVVMFASRDCGTPFISLDSVDISEKAGALLSLEFVVGRGALVFDFVDNHALAVVMNPYDAGLRRDVALLAGQPCHFFMSHASEFDRAVERITSIEVESVSE